jgi:hypothetical protein
MSCSSRISRILPAALPLTWHEIPADFQPPATHPVPITDDLLLNGHQDMRRSPFGLNEPAPASPTAQDVPPIVSPSSPLQTLSWRSLRSEFSPQKREHERYLYEASQERPESHGHAISPSSTQKRNLAFQISSPAPFVDPYCHEDTLVSVCSSPPFNSRADTTRWTVVAAAMHGRQSHQSQSAPSGNRADAETHHHRYSHVVRTDALTPSSTQQSVCGSFPTSSYQRQPWLTDNNEIDWATYFRIQPLPMSATSSRLEATVHHVDGMWSGAARMTSP